MTFDPHPAVLLKPGVPRFPLTTLQQRQELLAGFSPEILLLVPTTREFLAITDEEFLRQIVCGDAASGMGATLLVEGPTFTYGRGAKGTVETLKKEGPSLGFETLVVPTQEQSLTDMSMIKVSSSAIRWLISQGRVADAAKALGRPYALRGTVVEGQKRGRTIGFPTANLESTQLVPAAGVYAGRAVIDGQSHPAAISVGDNPTFGGKTTTVEAFLLGFSGDLYGKVMELSFHAWVREMYAFAGVDPLVTQMNRDVEWTKRMIEK
jgi:riboflavin kinase/FMN adenylyltransferase